MTKRMALALSTGMAAAVVALVAVLLWQAGLLQPSNTGAALAEGVEAAPTATPAAPGEVERLRAANAALLQREEIYQQRLGEANRLLRGTVQPPGAQQTPAPQSSADATISQPPSQIAAGQEPPAQTSAGQEEPPAPNSGQMLTSEEAIDIALAYTGGGKVREVEIETRGGVTAYEIKVDRRKVLVDAYTGEVIIPSGANHDDDHHDDDDDD